MFTLRGSRRFCDRKLVGGGEGEVGEDEAVDVDPLVDDFGDGLAGAMAGSKSTTLKLQTTG